jgi:hypothetical protein
MSRAVSCLVEDTDSTRAGLEAGRKLREGFGRARPSAVIAYATINHDQNAVLLGLREALGPGVLVVGASGQGVMTRGTVLESGFVVGAMALGGDGLLAVSARADDVHVDGAGKGRQLGRDVVRQLGHQPKVLILLYDPLRGVDVNEVLSGLRQEVTAPIVGGAASQPAGPVAGTFQYHGDSAFEGGAVALALDGPFSVDIGLCQGVVPTGIVVTATRTDGNRLLELDGRPALDVWSQSAGVPEVEVFLQEHIGAVPMGVERTVVREGREETIYLIRSAFGVDRQSRAITLQASIPQGSPIMLHHRTVDVVTQGAAAMARDLRARLGGRRPWAALGFECGGRTTPFLGPSETLDENIAVQKVVAPDAAWLGLITWGEIAPCGGQAEFHNYSYPLLVLSE